MKRIYFDRAFSALLLLGWMSLIFMFSAQTGDTSGNTSGSIVDVIINMFYPKFNTLSPAKQLDIIEFWQIIVRKTAHFTEYAILGVLCANALRTFKINTIVFWTASVSICVLYAISDEIHQYFVPDRACRILDVCIDTAGAVSGIAFFVVFVFLIKKIKEKRK